MALQPGAVRRRLAHAALDASDFDWEGVAARAARSALARPALAFSYLTVQPSPSPSPYHFPIVLVASTSGAGFLLICCAIALCTTRVVHECRVCMSRLLPLAVFCAHFGAADMH